jgi:uncharacterized membrane protein (UPF0127 family)
MPGQATVTIRDKQWQAYLATTYQELLQGLSGVEAVPAGTGMLFVLPADQAVTITTQLMRFPMDIIFISSSLAVVDVARGVVPGLLVSEATPIRYFLEVNAGEATGIEAGDSVSIVVYQTAAAFDPSQIVGFAIPLVALGFVCSMAGGVVSALAGHEGRQLLPKTKRAPTREDVRVEVWEERDRLHIGIQDKETGEYIASWWDDEAREMFEQGLFKRGPKLAESVLDYAEEVGLLAPTKTTSRIIHPVEVAEPSWTGAAYYAPDEKGRPTGPPLTRWHRVAAEKYAVVRGERFVGHVAHWTDARNLAERLAYEELNRRLLPKTTSRVYFVGPCKVSLGRCLTHNQPVGKKTRCPESPLTDEEWEAAYELVIAAFPEGQPNPWVDGWWPQTLEEAQMAIRRYEVGLRNAVWMYEAKSRAAVDLYRRSAERAAYHYKQYVMREYERRPHREAVAERERVEASPKLAGPRERTELPIELHYFADTADHIEGSMNHNGLRAKIDQTFREAIARAQGSR